MVSVITGDKQIKSKVLSFAVTKELDILSTNVVITLCNNSVQFGWTIF